MSHKADALSTDPASWQSQNEINHLKFEIRNSNLKFVYLLYYILMSQIRLP